MPLQRFSLLFAVICSCALCLLAVPAASATPVTYSFTGTFSGSLGGVSFMDTEGTFLLSSDTNSVTTSDYAYFFNTDGTSTFQLGSSAPVSFLSSTFGVESEFGAASFMDAANNFAAGEFNEVTPYDVLTNPSITSGMFASYGANPASTTGGNLILTGANGDVTFQTTDIAPTPEPSTLLLAATGIAGAVAGVRRRFRS